MAFSVNAPRLLQAARDAGLIDGGVKPFPQTIFITEKRDAEPAPPPSDK